MFGCCDRHQLDQTSTLGGRSLVSQFGRHFIKFTMYIIDISSKLRPNFDTGGVEIWSKFGRSFDTWGVEIWSKFRPNFDTHIVQNRLVYLSKQTIMSKQIYYLFNNPSTQILYFLDKLIYLALDKLVCCLDKIVYLKLWLIVRILAKLISWLIVRQLNILIYWVCICICIYIYIYTHRYASLSLYIYIYI